MFEEINHNGRNRRRFLAITAITIAAARENPLGPTTAEAFAPEALYEIKIDANGDAVADIAYRMRVSSAGGVQTATLRRVEGAQAAGANDSGQAIVEGAPVSTGRE